MTHAQLQQWAMIGLFGCIAALFVLGAIVAIGCMITGSSDVPEFVYGVGVVIAVAGAIFLYGTR